MRMKQRTQQASVSSARAKCSNAVLQAGWTFGPLCKYALSWLATWEELTWYICNIGNIICSYKISTSWISGRGSNHLTDTLLWSEKWPFCHSFIEGLPSTLRSCLLLPTSEQKRNSYSERSLRNQYPAASSEPHVNVRLQGASSPSNSTFTGHQRSEEESKKANMGGSSPCLSVELAFQTKHALHSVFIYLARWNKLIHYQLPLQMRTNLNSYSLLNVRFKKKINIKIPHWKANRLSD